MAAGCQKVAHAKGLCPMHYVRVRKHGDLNGSAFPPKAERFWGKVVKGDGCWPWTGALNERGYGVFHATNGPRLAHRVAYEFTMGVGTSAGLFVCHHCDNPACVRPDHLFLGTCRDNVRDMIAKGRMKVVRMRGEKHPHAKLREDQVRLIKAARKAGTAVGTLARNYGVCADTISKILHGRSWSHMEACE